MLSNNNQIAVFRDSVYKDGFGFNVDVFLNKDNMLQVQSNGLLLDTYDDFSDFIDDLAFKNPNWHTYYYVDIDDQYKHIVESKLQETIENIFGNLSRCIGNTSKHSWGLKNGFVKDCILESIKCSSAFDFLCTQKSKPTETSSEPHILDQFWNGYCPESFLKGERVRMRLNRNDFYESEATGLQIAVLRGVQAIIMNFRGKGEFRSTPEYADEIENGELLSPQNTNRPPFNNPTEIFENSQQIEEYIKGIL